MSARLPVDRGWAWAVAVGAAINTFWSLGSFSVYGVIFVEVLNMYQTSSALSSVMFSVFMATNAVAVLAQALLTGKLTERSLGIIAGFSFALSLCLQFVAPNVYFFIITFGVFGGIGSVFTMYTGIVALGTYFDKKLSIASGLAFVGASCGQFIIPQLLKVLINTYGLKGAMLVLGALHLHPLVSAMLFRPVEFYERKSRKAEPIENGRKYELTDNNKNNDQQKELMNKSNNSIENKDVEVVISDPKQNTKDLSIKESFRLLCTSKRFYLFAAGRSLCVIANYLLILFIPPLAASKGSSLSEVSLLLTVMGAVDLPSRPFHGWLVSLKQVDVTYYIGVTSIVCSGIVFACTFIPSSSVALIYVMGISMTVLYNPNLCLMNVVTIESVGRELFPRAMMLYMMVTYTFLTFLPTLFGRLFDVLGSYTVPMSICAVCGVVGGSLTILEKRFRPKHDTTT